MQRRNRDNKTSNENSKSKNNRGNICVESSQNFGDEWAYINNL